jgi:hypothetical protein
MTVEIEVIWYSLKNIFILANGQLRKNNSKIVFFDFVKELVGSRDGVAKQAKKFVVHLKD